jgi:hypothetical protein
MSRLTRIVCDNPDCRAQVEFFTAEYFRQFQGSYDTPSGWYALTWMPPEAAKGADDADQPRYFCSVECVRQFDGGLRRPENRDRMQR